MFGDDLANGGYELLWDFDDGLVFGDSLFLGLRPIMSEDSLDPLLVPPWGKSSLSHGASSASCDDDTPREACPQVGTP